MKSRLRLALLLTLLAAAPGLRAAPGDGLTLNINGIPSQPNYLGASSGTGAFGAGNNAGGLTNSLVVGQGLGSLSGFEGGNSIIAGYYNFYDNPGYAIESSLVVGWDAWNVYSPTTGFPVSPITYSLVVGVSNAVSTTSALVAGVNNYAVGRSFLLGDGLIGDATTPLIVQGQYNEATPPTGKTFRYAVGNGYVPSSGSPVRRNAFEIYTDGEAAFRAPLSLFNGAATTPSIVLDPVAGNILVGGRSVLTSGFLGNTTLGDPGYTLGAVWKGASAVGSAGYDKVVVGPLSNTYTGATIGAHNSALNAWTNLNIAGTNIIFRSGEAEKARLSSAGLLGLGTTNPQFGVDVHSGHVAFKNATSPTDGGVDAKNMGVGWVSSNAGNVLSNLITVDRNGYYGGDFRFYSRDPGGNSLPQARMSLTTYGNLGLGTTTPADKLEVSYGNIRISADKSTPGAKVQSINFVRSNYDPTGIAASIDFVRAGGAANGVLAFSTNGGSSLGQTPAERMRIDNNGNVGIGTNDPQAMLDVNGSAKISGAATMSGAVTMSSTVTMPRQGDVGMGQFGNGGSDL